MKLFACPACAHVVYFDNTRCSGCGSRLAFDPDLGSMLPLAPSAPAGTPITRATEFATVHRARSGPERTVRLCANYVEHEACNWSISASDPEPYCRSCRLNQMIPCLAEHAPAWRRLEAAKRRLVYTLLALRLPLVSRTDDPRRGLAFAFLADTDGSPVVTGHEAGVITINVAEADDAHREHTRLQFGEKYRSLIGHFRHESGHYYWLRLVDGQPLLGEFRSLFGDERLDYAQSLARHYAEGPRPDWMEYHVSPYAAAHPWEDWAETWAHYLHITDTLETARSYGLSLRPDPAGGAPTDTLRMRELPTSSFDAMISAWVPLTLALNDLNRSMGLQDLYPFPLSPTAIAKLSFVHRVVDTASHASTINAGVSDRRPGPRPSRG